MSTMTLDSVKDFETLAAQKNIELRVKYKENRCVICDKNRVKQVITNLIGNALKFTPDRGKIDITVSDFPKDKDYILVSIKDTGIGIPKDKKTQIFEKFSQINPNAQKATEGTGLGLAISKMIVEKVGGQIWLEGSNLGKGSEFCFIIKKCDKQDTSTDKEFHEYCFVKPNTKPKK